MLVAESLMLQFPYKAALQELREEKNSKGWNNHALHSLSEWWVRQRQLSGRETALTKA